MNIMAYIQNRLGEHSTQVALSADFMALLAAGSGQTSWSMFVTVLVGSLPAIVFPSK